MGSKELERGFGIVGKTRHSFPNILLLIIAEVILFFKPFYVTDLFLYSLETSENLKFSDVSRGHKKRPVA